LPHAALWRSWHVGSPPAHNPGRRRGLERGSPRVAARAPWDRFRWLSSGSPSLRTVLPVTGFVPAWGWSAHRWRKGPVLSRSADQAGLMHGEEGVVSPLVQELSVEAGRLPVCQLSEQDCIKLVHHGSYLPSGAWSVRLGSGYGGDGGALGWNGGWGSHGDLSLVGDCCLADGKHEANERKQAADRNGRAKSGGGILGAANRAISALNSNSRFRAQQLSAKFQDFS